nr:hypothetical protein [uncultured Pseudomonas sp.]
MSNDKMREEFEAWTRRRFNGLSLLRINLPGSPTDGQYEVIATRYCWDAWQASRAAVLVQMPQQSGVNLDWNQAIRYCIQAVEAEGLGWKP